MKWKILKILIIYKREISILNIAINFLLELKNVSEITSAIA